MRGHPETGAPCCLDCVAEFGKTADDYYYGPVWCFGYRRRFYNDSDYQPMYNGNSDLSLDGFDESDIRSFDTADEGDDSPAEAFDDQSVFDS